MVASRSTVDGVLSGFPVMVTVSWTLKKRTLRTPLKYNIPLSIDYCQHPGTLFPLS